MKVQAIDTIVWDLDGTIIDSFQLFIENLRDSLVGTSHKMPTREIVLHNFHGSLGETIANIMVGLSDEEHEQIFNKFIAGQEAHYETIDHLLLADAASLIKAAHAKGIKQVVVTNRASHNNSSASPVNIIKKAGFDNVIDRVISGDDTEFWKPDIKVFQGDLPTGKTLVIGDQFVDAKFAQNLNAKAVLVDRHPEGIVHLERLGPDWEKDVTIVKSLGEVELV